MNSEDEHDQCESDIDGFPVGSPHSPVLEDPDCDGCREEFGAPSNCTDCPYRNHPKAKPIPPLVKETGSFCPYCGHDVDWSKPTAPLSIALPCGHEGPDDAKFCPDCGVTIEYDCEGEQADRCNARCGCFGCQLAKAHDGQHVDGGTTWGFGWVGEEKNGVYYTIEPDDITLLPDFPEKKSNIVISTDEPGKEGEAKGRVLVPAGHSDCKVCNPTVEEIPIPNIKRKRCDFHEILHPNDIECPLCDGTAITCTCGLILFWDDAREHFKTFRNHPYQIHVPVATKEREKEES